MNRVFAGGRVTTLRRGLKLKFENILKHEAIFCSDGLECESPYKENYERLSELLVDAVMGISGIARKTDEMAGEYNVELFRGDYKDYPQSVQEIARVLRDTWMFSLPSKPHKKSKGQYAFYIQAMEAIKQNCAEFGVEVLIKVHADWKNGFKNGLAPYTVAKPTSLVNMCAAKARELREANNRLVEKKKDANDIPLSY